jgi:hypothetical protein
MAIIGDTFNETHAATNKKYMDDIWLHSFVWRTLKRRRCTPARDGAEQIMKEDAPAKNKRIHM